jgi:hypothetical protein
MPSSHAPVSTRTGAWTAPTSADRNSRIVVSSACELLARSAPSITRPRTQTRWRGAVSDALTLPNQGEWPKARCSPPRPSSRVVSEMHAAVPCCGSRALLRRRRTSLRKPCAAAPLPHLCCGAPRTALPLPDRAGRAHAAAPRPHLRASAARGALLQASCSPPP